MKEKFAKLVDVKSIMTLALTLVFCVLALCGTISGGEFLSIFTMIVGFYFGTQATKKAQGEQKAQTGAVVEMVNELPKGIPAALDVATYEQIQPSDGTEN